MSECMEITIVRIEEKLDMALERLEKHDHILNGNGKDGMVVEMDRVKRLVAYGGGILGAAVTLIAAWVKTK